MSNSKMREDFEVWECYSDQGPQTDPIWMEYSSASNAYGILSVQANWIVWQASREALVIELPMGGYWAGYDNEHMMESRDVRDAIEAAGVKVKP